MAKERKAQRGKLEVLQRHGEDHTIVNTKLFL